MANYPRTHGLELPPTPSAVVRIAKAVAVADAEAGRGGAPNNPKVPVLTPFHSTRDRNKFLYPHLLYFIRRLESNKALSL